MIKVLIAEDEPTCRMTLAEIVQQAGHAPICSTNGIHAWETICANPDIRLLITDVRMPGLDGCELIRLIRGRKELRAIPAIIVSGLVGPKTIAEFLDSGATWFLPKPIASEQLNDYMAKAIGDGGE